MISLQHTTSLWEDNQKLQEVGGNSKCSPLHSKKTRANINSAKVQATALQSAQLANQGVQSLGAEALAAQAAQGNLAVPFPVGWRLEQPALVGGDPAHGSGWNEMSSKAPSNSNHSGIV